MKIEDIKDAPLVAPSKERELTPKQQMFVREYLVDLNATQAAIRAGYSAKTAEEQGYQLLRKTSVQAAIQLGMDARAQSIEINATRVLKEIGRLAFFDPRKLLNADGTPKPIHELDDDTAAAVAGVEIVTKGNEDLGYADILKIKLADKSKNLEMLGRHLKLFTDKIEVDVGGELAQRMKEARERTRQG
jgi:phage terminase small subunit